MWGGIGYSIPDMDQRLYKRNINDTYIQDTNFLNDEIWRIVQESVLQHDSFSCDKFGGGKPFPTKRIDWEHIGSVFIDGKMRQEDVDILAKAEIPKQCIHTK